MPRRSGHQERSARAIRDNLDRLLKKHGMTGAELARRTAGAVSASDITRILNGKTQDPGSSKLKAIADVLGEPVTVFWEGVDPATPAEIERSFAKFKRSGLAREMSAELERRLKKAALPFGPLPVDGWYNLLNVLRSQAE